ncbi:methyltransferase [Histoplasma capsulatum G186AR]|uniref:Methyltransferase n=1 Tax=Ajellomyces capsulatus TaxID=5037 RepID=A0A8H7YUB7_AJECA|nr:methyltransferase [Histoplasma capsulatum]QSS74274.1 methyltransferase [Histoplasma capsulatum G186AR]
MANPTNAEALKAWELNASFWDQHMGYEGNDYYRIVELPSLERMAAVKPGDRALDLATGNGLVARWLASNGARVIATDGSQAMIDHAKHRSTNANGENVNSISYQILDATSTQSFENFIAKETAEEGPFDIVVMNMAIMDIATLEPLAAALPKLLKQNTGRFVATLLHPLITAGSTRVLEYGDSRETGREEEHVSLKITTYLHSPAPMKAEAMKGQPFYQYTFHRPIHDVLSPFLRSGLVLDAFEEPDFDPEYNNSKQIDPRSLRYVTEIPKILAFRMRAIGY